MTSGIYCFVNKSNGKRYVGQSQNIKQRLYDHHYTAERGKEKCTALQRALNKYGWDGFDIEILEECEVFYLNDREIYYIQKFQSNNNKHGYNLSSGGESGMRGYKFPPEFGEKIRQRMKGHVTPPHVIEILRKLNTGKVVSEETRKKMSENNVGFIGRKHSKETKLKMSGSHSLEKAYQFGKKTGKSASQYYGVYILHSKGHVYWCAHVKVNGIQTHIGSSKDETEAAKMYDAYIIDNNLPHPLNFPL